MRNSESGSGTWQMVNLMVGGGKAEVAVGMQEPEHRAKVNSRRHLMQICNNTLWYGTPEEAWRKHRRHRAEGGR